MAASRVVDLGHVRPRNGKQTWVIGPFTQNAKTYHQIAFTAWFQRQEAHRITREVHNALYPEKRPTPTGQDVELGAVNSGPPSEPEPANNSASSARKYAWTHVHSFYAVMGGFVYDTSDLPDNEQFLPGNRTRVTLAPDAVIYIARLCPWLLPDISEESIQDKSKANSLAKGVVCVQAFWFILQTIFRLADGLPISLLELSTAAHSLCALLVYALWWRKPLDVESPTVITGEDSRELFAFLAFF